MVQRQEEHSTVEMYKSFLFPGWQKRKDYIYIYIYSLSGSSIIFYMVGFLWTHTHAHRLAQKTFIHLFFKIIFTLTCENYFELNIEYYIPQMKRIINKNVIYFLKWLVSSAPVYINMYVGRNELNLTECT